MTILPSLVSIHDQGIQEQDHIIAFTKVKQACFKKGAFVKILDEDSENKFWIGLISTSNSNICPTSKDPFDETLLTALYNSPEKKNVIDKLGTLIYYKVKLLKFCEIEIVEGNSIYDFRNIVDRPQYGSKILPSYPNEIVELLKIPKFDKDFNNALGFSQTIDDLPICITDKMFNTHIAVSGTTGSGKSNVNANLISIAKSYGKAVIIHDAKQDFKNIKNPNDERIVQPSRILKQQDKYNCKRKGMKNVIKVGFYGLLDKDDQIDDFDKIVFFKLSNFYPEELASLFFYAEGEENQYEELVLKLKKDFINDKTLLVREGVYLDDLIDSIKNNQNDNINSSTKNTIVNKMVRRKDSFSWLVKNTKDEEMIEQKNKKATELKQKDRLNKYRSEMNKKSKNNEITLEDDKNSYLNYKEKIIKEFSVFYSDVRDLTLKCFRVYEDSPIILISYEGKTMEITYSFVLNRLLKIVQDYRDDVRSEETVKSYEVVQVVDEAHRLFEGKSKVFKAELLDSFSKVIKEGRVKKH
jgi:hypothetical protein